MPKCISHRGCIYPGQHSDAISTTKTARTVHLVINIKLTHLHGLRRLHQWAQAPHSEGDSGWGTWTELWFLLSNASCLNRIYQDTAAAIHVSGTGTTSQDPDATWLPQDLRQQGKLKPSELRKHRAGSLLPGKLLPLGELYNCALGFVTVSRIFLLGVNICSSLILLEIL